MCNGTKSKQPVIELKEIISKNQAHGFEQGGGQTIKPTKVSMID
jgi:hypothetical protein